MKTKKKKTSKLKGIFKLPRWIWILIIVILLLIVVYSWISINTVPNPPSLP